MKYFVKALVFMSAAFLATSAMSQSGYTVEGSSLDTVVRSGDYGGQAGINDRLCWRAGYWTPAQAIEGCDPDLVKKSAPAPMAAPAPMPAPMPAPAPAPAPMAAAPAPMPAPMPAPEPVAAPKPMPAPMPAPVVRKIALDSKVLFDFNKADLKSEGKAVIDREIVSQLPTFSAVDLVLISGHADRIGSESYNQRLSERRAETLRAYLVGKGLPNDKIESLGLGKTQPVTGDACQQTNRQALINCLAPDRRVEIEIKGDAK